MTGEIQGQMSWDPTKQGVVVVVARTLVKINPSNLKDLTRARREHGRGPCVKSVQTSVTGISKFLSVVVNGIATEKMIILFF